MVSVHRVAYTAPGLLMLDGVHLSQREKIIMAQELAGLDREVFKLGVKWEWDIGFFHFLWICCSLVVYLWVFTRNTCETSTIKTRKMS